MKLVWLLNRFNETSGLVVEIFLLCQNWWQVKEVCHSLKKMPLKLNFVWQTLLNFLFLILRIIRAIN